MKFWKKYKYLYGVHSAGFTLIELLVTMVIVGFILTAIGSTFFSQNRIHKAQEQVAMMQQNVRAVMYMMAKEIRMAGYDSERSDGNGFGIDDIQFRNTSGDPDNSLEYSSIAFSADDYDGSGSKTIRYVIHDGPSENTMELARQVNPTSSPTDEDIMAENIEAFCIAYAFDDNGDREIDTADGEIIWAIDSNNDNSLDLNLDADHDGDIDANDISAGGSLISPVGRGSIRAVRIWVLGKVETPDWSYSNNNTYVVGNRIVQANDHYRRKLVESVIKCRNMIN